MKDSPKICIVGYPRSGTTLVYHILMSSDIFPVFDFDETHYFSHFFRMYGNLDNRRNLEKVLNDLQKRGIVKDAAAFKNQLDLNKVSYSSLFGQLMGYLSKEKGKTSWIEKTPWHMRYLKEIKDAVPSIKFIFLVRDPRAVALSVSKAGWVNSDAMVRVASGWRWHMELAEKSFKFIEDSILTIRYEDLIKNTENTLEQISSFFDIPLSIQDVLNKKIGVVGGSNSSFKKNSEDALYHDSLERWKEDLTAVDQAKITYLLADFLEKYDYKLPHYSLSIYEKVKIRMTYLFYSFWKKVTMGSFFIRKIFKLSSDVISRIRFRNK